MPVFNLIFARISVTTDGWTSITGDPYLSLTAHFITTDWHLTTRCLFTMYSPESHTADHISNFVKEGVHEYGLRIGNVVSITTDSAANMVAAARKLGKFSCLLQWYSELILYNCIGLMLDLC